MTLHEQVISAFEQFKEKTISFDTLMEMLSDIESDRDRNYPDSTLDYEPDEEEDDDTVDEGE